MTSDYSRKGGKEVKGYEPLPIRTHPRHRELPSAVAAKLLRVYIIKLATKG